MKKKMDIDSFMDEIVRMVKEELGSGYEVNGSVRQKNNGISLRTVVISDGTSAVLPCIYMERYYAAYMEKGSMDLIVKDIIRVYEKNRGNGFPAGMVADREQMLDRVLFRIINTEKNAGILADVPHHDLCGLGLSVVFFLCFQTGECRMEASVLVSRKLMEMWDSSETELLEHAQRNTPERMKASMCSMEEILSETGETVPDSGQERETAGMMPLYVLTNEQKLYGASCILYDGVLERAAEQFGSGFYVLPSSVHEVILVPETGSPDGLRKLVSEINRSDVLGAEDVLADEVYYYDMEKRRLSIAGLAE